MSLSISWLQLLAVLRGRPLSVQTKVQGIRYVFLWSLTDKILIHFSKTSVTPPSQLVPVVQTAIPVSVPTTAPDGRFGYQVLPPAPTYMGSQLIAHFEQDRFERKVARPMRSSEGKTSGAASTQVTSGLDPRPTHAVQPPHSSGLRSNTPDPSSRHILHVLPQSHMEDQQLRSRQLVLEETHCAQLAPSNDGRFSPLTEEEGKGEQLDAVHNDLWNIEEEKDDDKQVEEEEEGGEKGERRISDVPVEDNDKYMSDNLDLYGGTLTQVVALTIPGELYFILVSSDNSRSQLSKRSTCLIMIMLMLLQSLK
jgi:hypothetical protein